MVSRNFPAGCSAYDHDAVARHRCAAGSGRWKRRADQAGHIEKAASAMHHSRAGQSRAARRCRIAKAGDDVSVSTFTLTGQHFFNHRPYADGLIEMGSRSRRPLRGCEGRDAVPWRATLVAASPMVSVMLEVVFG